MLFNLADKKLKLVQKQKGRKWAHLELRKGEFGWKQTYKQGPEWNWFFFETSSLPLLHILSHHHIMNHLHGILMSHMFFFYLLGDAAF